MRWRGYLVGVVAVLLIGKAIVFPEYAHRYRLTIEVDTPDGVRVDRALSIAANRPAKLPQDRR